MPPLQTRNHRVPVLTSTSPSFHISWRILFTFLVLGAFYEMGLFLKTLSVHFNHQRTQEQRGLTFVTRVYRTWTMRAQWAGKLMTAYIWRLYTCSVKDVTLLPGTVEPWWLKRKRTKHRYSTAASSTQDISDDSTTSTHSTTLCSFVVLALFAS